MATYNESASDSVTLTDALAPPKITIPVSDGVSIAMALAEGATFPIFETLAVSGELSSTAQLSLSASDEIEIGELFAIVWNLAAEDGIEIGETLTVDRESVVRLAESIVLAGVATNFFAALEVIAATLAMDDLSKVQFNLAAADEITVALTSAELMTAHHEMLDSLVVAGETSAAVVIVAVAEDEATLSQSLASTLAAFASIEETLSIGMQITIGEDTYLAWVLNTESRAISSYVNYPFNSFAKIGDSYYGATDTGIYELAGDDDAGAPINAAIRSGLLDFGTPRQKRMDSLYLGYSASGEMILKMVSTDGGVKRERHYTLSQASDNVRDGRIKMAKGRKSRYWGFELGNIDGADFAIESVEFVPLVLTRRLKNR